MPDQTVNRGYPYPVDTDPIDVAGDVQALAEAIDLDTTGFQIPSRFYAGDATFDDGRFCVLIHSVSAATDGSGFINVGFEFPAGVGFTEVPRVMLTMGWGEGGPHIPTIGGQGITTNGFTALIWNSEGNAVVANYGTKLDYIAIGRWAP